MTATLAFFATRSEQGRALKTAVATLLANKLCALDSTPPLIHHAANYIASRIRRRARKSVEIVPDGALSSWPRRRPSAGRAS